MKSTISDDAKARITAALRVTPNATVVARQFKGVAGYGTVLVLARKAEIVLPRGRSGGSASSALEKQARASKGTAPVVRADEKISEKNRATASPHAGAANNTPRAAEAVVAAAEEAECGVEASKLPVINLIRALRSAQIQNDRGQVASLIACTPSELLRNALSKLRASRGQWRQGPVMTIED